MGSRERILFALGEHSPLGLEFAVVGSREVVLIEIQLRRRKIDPEKGLT